MIAAGLLDEIDNLIKQGLKSEIRKANVIGYNEILDYRDGLMSKDEAISMIKQNSRNYAKRQYTWFRRLDKDSRFIDKDSLISRLRSDLYSIQ